MKKSRINQEKISRMYEECIKKIYQENISRKIKKRPRKEGKEEIRANLLLGHGQHLDNTVQIAIISHVD